jgi:hypothetical protein
VGTDARDSGVAPDDGRRSVDYASATFDFVAVLTYDRFGLVVDYPGLARRHH